MDTVIDPQTYSPLDDREPWNDRLQDLEVISVNDEAPNVKTFTFRSGTRAWFRYKPGQFITLELPVADEPVHRTYTLSSSPSRPFSIAVTVKVQPGSIGTQYMFDHLKPGSRIKAIGPHGDFTHHKHPASKYLFISAGSGVTPMMSMLRWLNDCLPSTDVVFAHCARQPEDIIFREELSLLGGRMPGLSLRYLIEQRSSRESWPGFMGRIDAASLALMAPDFHDREVFCCGPEPFMRVVSSLLESAGFDMARYHQESFNTPASEPSVGSTSSIPPQGDAAGFSIRFMHSNVEVECIPGKTVLQLARANGVRIPAACESGMCGTCRIKKISGEVCMVHDGGILDSEIADNYILACCSKPTIALEIEA